jgi:hypothetical protein
MSMRIHQARCHESAWQTVGAWLRLSSESAGVVYPEIDWLVAIGQPRSSHRP